MSTREANLLGALSLHAADRIRSAISDRAPGAGEGPAGLMALATFMEGGSIEELRRVLGLSHSATVRLVDKLERSGLVRRRAAEDARAVSIALTADGRRVASQIREARMRALAKVLEPLSAVERDDLARLHEKLLAGAVAGGEERGRICRLCDAEACGHRDGCCPVTEAPPRPDDPR